MVKAFDDMDLTNKCVVVTDTMIYINGQFILHKDFSMTGKEYLLDVLGKYYSGQIVHVVAYDGENIKHTGFLDYMEYLCEIFKIPHDKVQIETHGNDAGNFKLIPLKLGIFLTTKIHVPEILNRDLTDAKLIGMSLGRSNPTRLRLAYEINHALPNDNYTIFQPHINDIMFHYRHYTQLYQQELDWVKNHKFESDLTSGHQSGTIDWFSACNAYGNIWNKFYIEIVSETDALTNYWFTEKTARCLMTGKPFILVSGQGSLTKLHSMGFKTFGDIIDETYDLEQIPFRRINKIVQSLQELNSSPDRMDKINAMYAIANQNISLYNDYCKV